MMRGSYPHGVAVVHAGIIIPTEGFVTAFVEGVVPYLPAAEFRHRLRGARFPPVDVVARVVPPASGRRWHRRRRRWHQ